MSTSGKPNAFYWERAASCVPLLVRSILHARLVVKVVHNAPFICLSFVPKTKCSLLFQQDVVAGWLPIHGLPLIHTLVHISRNYVCLYMTVHLHIYSHTHTRTHTHLHRLAKFCGSFTLISKTFTKLFNASRTCERTT